MELGNRLEKVHETLRSEQLEIRSQDSETTPAFKEGDYVLMVNKRRRKGESSKLAPKFVGPYQVIHTFNNNCTHLMASGNQEAVVNEARLELYHRPRDPRA